MPEQSARPEGTDVPPFVFQLIDAYVFEASLERRAASEGDPSEPRFRTNYQTFDWPEGNGFIGRLTVEAAYRFRDEALCVVRSATQAHFASDEEVLPTSDEVALFRQRDSAVLVWPYARAHLAELVRMMNLSLPPLPTVDVRRALDALPLDLGDEGVATGAEN